MNRQVSRRKFLAAAAALAAATAAARHTNQSQRGPSFEHGVASGDPLHDRVILWTRVTTQRWYDDVEVKWQVARDPKMRRIVAAGRSSANIWRDFTVKVDVDGLEAGAHLLLPVQRARASVHRSGARARCREARSMRRASPWSRARICPRGCSTCTRWSRSAPISMRCCTSATTYMSTRNGTYGDGALLDAHRCRTRKS